MLIHISSQKKAMSAKYDLKDIEHALQAGKERRLDDFQYREALQDLRRMKERTQALVELANAAQRALATLPAEMRERDEWGLLDRKSWPHADAESEKAT